MAPDRRQHAVRHVTDGTRIASRKQLGATTYYHGDQLNSATTLTNSNGGVVSRQVLSPFGRRLTATGSDPIGLAGNRLDPLTGLYHMGAREMNPSSGLFITPDPSGAPDAEKPQTLNRYAYANNSPTNLVDLTGFQADEPNWSDGWRAGFTSKLAEWFNSVTGTNPHSENRTEAMVASAITKDNEQYIDYNIRTAPQQAKDAGSLILFAAASSGLADVALADVLVDVGVVEYKSLPALTFSKTTTPGIAANIEDAFAAGQPTVLARLEGRDAIRANRAGALQGQPKPPSTHSLDEYPFASSKQGGAGSQVAAVPRKEQNVQGGMISAFYQKYNIKDGDLFRVLVGK